MQKAIDVCSIKFPAYGISRLSALVLATFWTEGGQKNDFWSYCLKPLTLNICKKVFYFSLYFLKLPIVYWNANCNMMFQGCGNSGTMHRKFFCKFEPLTELMIAENWYFTSRTLFIHVFSVHLGQEEERSVVYCYHSVLLYNFIHRNKTHPITYLNQDTTMLLPFLRLFRRKYFSSVFLLYAVDLPWVLGTTFNYIPQAKSKGFQARRLKKVCLFGAGS